MPVLLAALVLSLSSGQEPSTVVLRIEVALTDTQGQRTPVPRHSLLISNDPVTSAPRRITTDLEGLATARLRPGRYIVESERATAFHGKAYEWIQSITVAASGETVLQLDGQNAEVTDAPGSGPAFAKAPAGKGFAAPDGSEPDADPSIALGKWRDSVVALWTPTTLASGSLIDGSGLLVTNARVVGAASSVEVQLTPKTKVAGSVLAADHERNIAVIWIDPQGVDGIKPLPLTCDQPPPSVTREQEIFIISVPMHRPKQLTSGEVSRVDPMTVDVDLARRSAGGPAFSESGDLIGITWVSEEDDTIGSGETRVVRRDRVCEVVAAARQKMAGATAPSGAQLPLEPERPFPVEALKQAAERRAGSLNPYQTTTDGFDVAFITPVLTYGAQYHADRMRRRTTSADTRTADPSPMQLRPIMDFANWSEYVWEFPPVLLIRATPKLAEGFWTKVGRAAAQTQGVALPPMKRYKSGFVRMNVFCGDKEVTPIHPFRIERRVTEKDSIFEGLYVVDPGALGPHCGSVKLVLYAEKDPTRAETRVVDTKILQQIWDDFAPYRDH
jgi:Trypsin-like peptidase domain